MEERFLKITNAAYKILEFFPESDPLKIKAKEKALVILENLPIVLATDGWASLQETCLPAGREKDSNQLKIDIDVFLSYLEIAKSQKWIDEINYLIISKEYKSIITEIEKVYREHKILGVLPDKFIDQNPDNKSGKEKQEKNIDVELTERQKKIIEILENNKKAQVSDIIRFLPNITKRTIRRDLDGLLSSGMVVRVGEWNKIFYQVLKTNKLSNLSENNDRTIMLS